MHDFISQNQLQLLTEKNKKYTPVQKKELFRFYFLSHSDISQYVKVTFFTVTFKAEQPKIHFVLHIYQGLRTDMKVRYLVELEMKNRFIDFVLFV